MQGVAMSVRGGGASGFGVDRELMGCVAAQLGSAGEEFDTAIDRYNQPGAGSPAFGSNVAGAWSDFHGTWADDLHLTGREISDLRDKVTMSRRSYSIAEDLNFSEIKLIGKVIT
jgi:hypothetical protein